MIFPIKSGTTELSERPMEVHCGKTLTIYTHVLPVSFQTLISPLATLDYGVDLQEICGTGVDRW